MGNAKSKNPNYGWISLRDLMFDASKCFNVGDNEMLNIPVHRHSTFSLNSTNNAIHRYNQIKDQWFELVKYPKNTNIICRACLFDKYNNILTLYCCEDRQCMNIYDIDIQKQKWRKTSTYFMDDGISNYIIVDETLHIIGNNKHCVWDNKVNKARLLHNLDNMALKTGRHTIIYLKNKKKLFLFGGYSTYTDHSNNFVFSYCLHNKIWTKLKVRLPIPLDSMAKISTSDEKYVILFGGLNRRKYGGIHISKNIFIFSVDKNKLYKSKCQCPGNYGSNNNNMKKILYRATICESKKKDAYVLISGYMRQCGILYVPKDIVLLINLMQITKYMHLTTNHKHWKISMYDLMQITE